MGVLKSVLDLITGGDGKRRNSKFGDIANSVEKLEQDEEKREERIREYIDSGKGNADQVAGAEQKI